MTSVWSISIRFPKPWQFGQAPRGLLKENSCGWGSSYARAHPGQSKRSEKRSVGPSVSVTEAVPAALAERGLQRLGQARGRGLVELHAVDEHHARVGQLPLALGQRLDRDGLAVLQQPAEAALLEVLEEVGARRAADRHGKAHEGVRPVRAPPQPLRRRLGRVARDLRSAGLAEDAAGPREEDAQVVVHLGRGRDGGAGIARGRALADRDRRAHAVHRVESRLLEPLEELPGERRQALHVASLPLGVERVEGEAALAGARDAGHHHQALGRDRDVDPLQVVDADAARDDRFSHGIGVSPRAALPPWRQSPIIPSGCLGAPGTRRYFSSKAEEIFSFSFGAACWRSFRPRPAAPSRPPARRRPRSSC